ncbi:hypothetical protein H632_c1438p0, partial [Helicosporidium sp. ATCC 50920]
MEYTGSGPGPSGRDSLDLEAIDMEQLMTYFTQPGAPSGVFGESGALQAQGGPYRGMGGDSGTFMGLPLPSAANLFSSAGAELRSPAPRGAGSGEGADTGYASDDSKLLDDSRGKRTAEQKAHAIQEKNRRAQKRFRERQKARMKDMTEQLDDMGGELGKLRMENNSLKNRNSILEKVLALRDEHIRVLQDEQQVFDLGSHAFEEGDSAAGQASLSGSTQPSPLLLGGAGSWQASRSSPGEAQPSSGNSLVPGSGHAAPGSAAAVAAEIRAVKQMPSEMVVARWKETVRELGNILVQIEGCPDESDPRHGEGLDALCRVLDAAGQLCMHTAVLHPTNMQKLIAQALDDGRSGVSSEDRARWAGVASSLQLSEEQKSQIISLRRIFLRRMARVVEDRRGILAKLQAVHVPDRMLALQSVISETLKVNECTVELKANLQEEHLAGMEFIGTVFKTIFNKLQKARAIVQSYPFYPDVYQISTLLALEREGTAALEA